MFEKGFTLIEVIISILIIGIIIVGIFPIFNQGIGTLISFTDKTDAINEARVELVAELQGAGAVTPSPTTIKFVKNDGEILASANIDLYKTNRNYSLPGIGEESLELNYYTYPISP